LGLEITPTDYYSAFALLVAGDCTWLSGSVHGGSIGVGGTFTAPSYLTTSAISPVDVTGSQFDSAQSYYESIQSLLSGLGTNAQASVIYGDGLMITCDDHTNILNHVAVDGGILSTTNFYLLKNCLFTAGWVIDVTGTGPVTIQGSPFPGVVERVVYNILGSGRIITGNTGVGGNILAPQNSYVQYTGVTYGRVIVGDVIFARQNNKPNCINFQTVNITNLCLKAVNVGDGFVYVVDLSNYVIGDLVCFNGDCHSVTGGVVGDVNHDGVIDNVMYVTPPFGQSHPPNTMFVANVDPNTPRTPLTPTYVYTSTMTPAAATTAHVGGASSVALSILVLFFAMFLLL